jgi:predicted dehydrogenase
MPSGVCRWGILGTANIARKNWKAILNSENATLIAVASRDAARARQFVDDCQSTTPYDDVPLALGSYDELLASRTVDAVYIPLPTAVRKEWVVRAARAGKHVLVEKPCAVDEGQLHEMLDACRDHNVQFMDGVMFLHSARMALIREVLHDGASVGQLRRIATQFSFRAEGDFLQSNIRVHSQLEPLGCLGDLGWYNIRLALWLTDWQLPESVSGRSLRQHVRPDSPGQVPVEFSGELFFADGISAAFYCSFVTEVQQWAHVSGTQGHLRIDDFVLPHFGSELKFEVGNAVYDINGCDFNMEPHSRKFAVAEYANSRAQAQETNMIRRFSANVLAEEVEPIWSEIALKTQRVLDACLRSAHQDGQRVPLTTSTDPASVERRLTS